MTKDPVCGMKVDEKSAPATSSYAGVTYAFCSPHCKQQFDQQPEQYARNIAKYAPAVLTDEAEEPEARWRRHRRER